MRVGIATAAELPDLDEDGPALLGALERAGIAAEPVVWTVPRDDWGAFDAVVVRTTWDYAPRRAAYLEWARTVAAATRLWNPPDVIAWNTDKRYLRDLVAAGVPVVPTSWVEPGAAFTPPATGEYVVKPVVSAGARDTARYRAGRDDARAARHVAEVVAGGRAVMVQPYVASVDGEEAETALVHIGGAYSHAIRKGPLLRLDEPGPDGLYALEHIGPWTAASDQRAVADAVLGALAARGWDDLLYARVDLLRDDAGAPFVLEVELTEPSLFLQHDPPAADRLASALSRALATGA